MTSRPGPSLERPPRVRLVALAGVALAVLALGPAYVAHFVRSLDTPEFQQALLDRASAAIGARVQARKVVVHGPARRDPRRRDDRQPPAVSRAASLTADALVLRYDLWSLLRGRLAFAKLSVERPSWTSRWTREASSTTRSCGGSRATPSAPSAVAFPSELAFSKLALDGARIVVRHPRAALMKAEGAELDSSVRLARTSVEGEGKLRVALLSLADAFFVRGVSAPLHASNGSLTLAPVRATLAGGDRRRRRRRSFPEGLPFRREDEPSSAHSSRSCSRKRERPRGCPARVVGDAAVEGSGGIATLEGKGQVRVESCRVTHAPLMTLLSTALLFPSSRAPTSTSAAPPSRSARPPGEPVAELQGSFHPAHRTWRDDLKTLAIDYDMTLALSPTLARRIPAEELRAAFRERGDGFVTIDFEVTGTTSAPRSDLAPRVGRAAAESGIKKLLRRRFF